MMNFQRAAILTATFLSCEVYCSLFTPNEYLTTEVTEGWESLVFRISNSISLRGSACARFSQWYCLDAYHTPEPQAYGGPPIPDISNRSRLLDPHAATAWFELLIREKWVDINMVNFMNPRDCCSHQVKKYLLFGLLHKMMNPDTYMAKLTDYKSESKPLNFLMVR
ncbi:uncharacterized protein LOC134841666 [Symsagittifera roscoffensis]|uniref:uncharacterized protein LOC134841666 n=1 Tax=Symsagittifera roscoffensis TaxID=84072 RepID=UPI00307C8D64